MARTQAADYEERRAEIVEHAARLFAERGFLGASIADLAKACDTSKSLIYHYYGSKEDILFDIMHSHVRALLDAAEQIAAKTIAPAAKLLDLTLAFMRLYVGAAARQRVLLNELSRLPAKRRGEIVGIQRRLIDLVQAMLVEIRPALARRKELQRPAVMLYFGMINWTHTWLDPKGAAKPEHIGVLAAEMFLEGLMRGELRS